MSVQVSTGFASAILGPAAFDTIFLNGVLRVYSGLQPASADAAATGVHVADITPDGDAFTPGTSFGLRFQRSGRYAFKSTAQTWKLKGLATGMAGWVRLCANAVDDGSASLVLPRVDGRVGVDGQPDIQLFLPGLSITIATEITVPSWVFAIPPVS